MIWPGERSEPIDGAAVGSSYREVIMKMDKTYPTIELIGMLYEHYELFFPGFTTNGQHVTGSYHYRGGGEAVDFDDHAKKYDELSKFAGYFYTWSDNITEMFSTNVVNGKLTNSGHYVKNGVRKSHDWARAAGLTTMNESGDHIHFAIATEAEAQTMLIKATQAALALKQDGVKGPKTTAKIKAVQKTAGITEDGVVGPMTVRAIRKQAGWEAVN
jgi:hypothetical protein